MTAAATFSLWALPPLAAAVLAVLALSLAFAAWRPDDAPWLPFAGLALLALPLVASLQFYAGYPLRLLTAQLSTWALQLAGLEAARSGAAMTVQGQLVIVDAPCSGVQLVWLGYFCACAAAAWVGLRDAVLLRRLPMVGLLVLSGNVLRNTLLVALEARPQGLGEAAHQAIGLGVTAAVCAAVLVWTPREQEKELRHADRH
ncbi:exosortase/archaeosortase family protein [Methylibium sp. T29]|nr:exosortase/archaeosortase family protein [Methylibium sp. T29]